MSPDLALSLGQMLEQWPVIPALLGVGGVWLAVFVWRVKSQPLLPEKDPRVLEENHHG